MPPTAITTDAVGLAVGETSYDVRGEQMRAYYAQPESKSGLPIVIVISEVYGVHAHIAHIADVCRRWAKLGYLSGGRACIQCGYRPNYVEADAKDGWQRAVEWLKKNGVS